MTLVYLLGCCTCDAESYVTSQWHNVEWTCPACGGGNSTSVCANEDGSLVTDPDLCGALVSTNPADYPGAVVGTPAS